MVKTAYEIAAEALRHLLSDQACTCQKRVVHGLGLNSGKCEQLARDDSALANQSCNHPIDDAHRQFVGPLVHRLVGNANCLGGGGCRASEEFYGL